MKLFATVLMVKILVKMLQIFKSGGTSLPGKLATRIYPNVLSVISRRIKIVMVTGTNGKTTTVRMIAEILEKHDFSFITNKSGANLQSGITTTLLNAMKLDGRFQEEYALLEIDEAAFKTVCPLLKPDFVVVTNFFRDQLDRFGELYTTLSGVKTGIKNSEETVLILNGDDSFCSSIGKDLPNKAYYYGTSSILSDDNDYGVTDGKYCIYCKSKYSYHHRTYGHLGNFYCPECGYRRPELVVSLSEPPIMSDTVTKIRLSVARQDHEQTLEGVIPVPGKYNVYNAVAAMTFSLAAGMELEKSMEAISEFEIGFGRMEDIAIGNKTLRIVLVKNAIGFNQVLDLFCSNNKPYPVAMIINDLIADGTDVSWLWDVDFEKLTVVQDSIPAFYASGIRGEDMMIRLKYAGLNMRKVSLNKDYIMLVDKGLKATPDNGYFYVFPTYTALMGFRKLLVKKFGIKKFWK
ncbi:MAG TPA: DUF1727 domain-containing protein [Clostridiales bacterium]|nr:DUF1727 domain-containing protein [Clostridiales bacterium]